MGQEASFDAVVSTYGVMFTPDQEKAATEILRVCRPGGKVGLANWTPQGFVGQMWIWRRGCYACLIP